MFKTSFISIALVSSTLACGAAQLYVVNYQANFNSGFGGLPPVLVNGSYTFEALPATRLSDGGTVAYYENHIRSGVFDLNGTVLNQADGVNGVSYLRVDDNIPYNEVYRDLYAGLVTLNGAFGPNFTITLAGLDFELASPNPTALNTLALPLSTADLDGFVNPENRNAVLVFRNANGNPFASYAPVQFVSIAPVPEPAVVTLLAIGVCAVTFTQRRKS